MFDGETLAMVFDAALLLGEVFRFRYPGATWSIGAKPKSSVNYGDPVVIGTDKFRMEFGVQMQMHGAVGLAMSNKPDRTTMSFLLKMRAFDLGLGPDPRTEPMSEWERQSRGLI